jgi:hypothetical protein
MLDQFEEYKFNNLMKLGGSLGNVSQKFMYDNPPNIIKSGFTRLSITKNMTDSLNIWYIFRQTDDVFCYMKVLMTAQSAEIIYCPVSQSCFL